MNTQKIIVVCGPTATGKSDYAVALAKKIGGEIISADSRQVYRGLDIGSGKITKKEMRGVPHYLLDVADPRRTFSVAQFQKKGTVAIKKIIRNGHTPIICGGTGFYIDTLVYGQTLPPVKPHTAFRKKLDKHSTQELANILRELDDARFASIDTNWLSKVCSCKHSIGAAKYILFFFLAANCILSNHTDFNVDVVCR